MPGITLSGSYYNVISQMRKLVSREVMLDCRAGHSRAGTQVCAAAALALNICVQLPQGFSSHV